MDGQEHQRPTEQERDQRQSGDGNVHDEDVQHRLLEVVENAPARAHALDDRLEGVVEQHEGPGLPGHVGPRPPMATPICAALSAGASLTPSPVIATTSPWDLSACTSRSFCSGTMRAKRLTVFTRRASDSSSIASSSGPVITSSALDRPISRPMLCAVPG